MPSFTVLTILPLFATIISAAFSIVILNHYFVARRRPHELMWSISFGLFSVGAACQVYADLAGGWTPIAARLYYLCGAILTVAYLGMGTAFLLFSRRVLNALLVVMVLFTAFATYTLFTVPVDGVALNQVLGYKAVQVADKTPRYLAAVSNTIGTILVVGGALWSGVAFWRKRIMKSRMIGVFLIAAGTTIVAVGGTVLGLTGLDNPEYHYLSMAIGVTVMFGGYLQTVRPAPAAVNSSPLPERPVEQRTTAR